MSAVENSIPICMYESYLGETSNDTHYISMSHKDMYPYWCLCMCMCICSHLYVHIHMNRHTH